MAEGSTARKVTEGCRWGIMSCGKIANDFATALRLVGVDDGHGVDDENGGGRHSVVACASSSAKRSAEFGAKHGVSPSRCYDDYAELAADPDVDVVYVASIHTEHKAMVLQLLERGKHVLCEKPMAVCARDTKEMVDKAREKGVFLMEGGGASYLVERACASHRAITLPSLHFLTLSSCFVSTTRPSVTTRTRWKKKS